MVKLDPKNIENILALTPLQEGMLFHYLQAPGSGIYFEQLSLEISGTIDSQAFEKAWNVVIETNEMLRTTFRWEKLEKPTQIVLKEHQCNVIFYDLSEKDDDQKKTALEEIKNKDWCETFDLQQVPFRVILCKRDEKKFDMIISNHHILYDGWSNSIILKEFFMVYHESITGKPLLKLPVKTPFKEFVRWYQSQDKSRQEKFWRDYLAGVETPAELPIKRRVEKITRMGDFSLILEKDIKNQLDIFVRNNRVTLAAIFYTAWGILLQKYCDSEDIIFGTTVSGRSGQVKGIENMVGLFINTIPLRTQTSPGEKIGPLVFRTDKRLRDREEFENTPLADIGGYSGLGDGGSLFNTIVVIENYPLNNRLMPVGGLLSIHSYAISETSYYGVSVAIMPFDEIELKFSFRQEFFEKEAIEYMARHFKGIIRNIIEKPETALSQLEIISNEEKNRILYEFNNTALEYPWNKTIHQLFEEQVEKAPDHIALVGATTVETLRATSLQISPTYLQITYRQLNDISNGVAGLLIEKGVQPDTIVGIMAERSLEMIAGILGILKSGGAYLPLDPDYPQERIDYMLKDSGAKLLVTANDKEGEKVRRWEGGKVLLESIIYDSNHLKGRPRRGLHHSSFIVHHSRHLAYVIYTSGSMGKPKAVLVEQRSVIRLIKKTNYIEFMGSDRILQSGAISFDASTFEIWGALLNGPGLVLLPKEYFLSSLLLRRAMGIFDISIAWMTSPLFNRLVDEDEDIFARLRYLLVGGDTLSPGHINRVRKKFPCLNIINGYGPTENTTFSTTFRIRREYTENIPIGVPIANSTVYIINKYDQLSPIGVPGELCVGGDGIARGYLNNPELTAEKFILPSGTSATKKPFEKGFLDFPKRLFNHHPQLTTHHSPLTTHHSPFYKTGDMARWMPDGNIEFIGRQDHQVKIRGFRVELGEIERSLLDHKEIKEAVVLIGDTCNETPEISIWAYFVSNREFTRTALREFLSGKLPTYMIPSHFVKLDKIPLNRNGKVDQKTLGLCRDEICTGMEFIAPISHREEIIAGIWQEILELDREQVGINDNFFDLGGNSLSIMRVKVKIKEQLGVDIPVTVLFQYPTVDSLARHLGYLEGIDTSEVIDHKKKEIAAFNRLDQDINETLQIFEA